MQGQPGWEDTINTCVAASCFSICILNDAPDNPEARKGAWPKSKTSDINLSWLLLYSCDYATILASGPASLSQTGC